MKIESKFDIGDLVFFMHKDRIVSKHIRCIRFPKRESIYSMDTNSGIFLKPKTNQGAIKYGFFKFSDVISDNAFKARIGDSGSSYESLVELYEDYLFTTKEELVESLMLNYC